MEEISHVLRIGVSACILSISFFAVELQFMTISIKSDLVTIISYMYEVGFMIGCLLSERYYTSNVEKKALIIAYTLTTCSGLSLSLEGLFSNEIYIFIIIAGYTLSGIGQSLLIVVMVAYATPLVRQEPTSPLLPILMALINFSGVIGSLLNYSVIVLNWNTTYVLLGLNLGLLFASIGISWSLKGIPRVYTINGDEKPEIPFENFSIVFYTYGMLYGLFASVMPQYLKHYHIFEMRAELCVYQGEYSLAYFIGALLFAYSLNKKIEKLGIVVAIAGCGIAVFGFVLVNMHSDDLNLNKTSLWLIDAIDLLLGFIDGIIEPLVLHKIVTRSNRPEFFTGLFYFLSAFFSIFIATLPM